MLESTFLIRASASVLAVLCLVISLVLCFLTPEGALFVFVIGCSWLGLFFLAGTTQDLPLPPSDDLGRAV